MHKKKSKKKTLIITLVLLIAIIISVVLVVINPTETTDNNTDDTTSEKDKIVENEVDKNSSTDANLLIGTFVYKTDGTVYEFKKDGTGSMTTGDYKFEYKYTAQNGNLEIDFNEEKVHDAKYTYSINDNSLTLVSKEGTVTEGQEYKLEKENK